MKADEIIAAPVPTDPREIALQLVLLFHSGRPWDKKMQEAWALRVQELFPDGRSEWNGREEVEYCADATTVVLCDCVRKALSLGLPPVDYAFVEELGKRITQP